MTLNRRSITLWIRRAAPWVWRAALLVWLASVIYPPTVRVTLMPPQTVETVKPQVCVHTRLIDEVQEWVMQESLVAVREMGAQTIVEFFPWAYAERVRGVYDWTQADRIMKHARNQGLQVIARFGLVPDWARPNPDEQQTTLNYLTPDAYPAFAEYAAAFVTRYADVVPAVIIWNEPNLAFEWGYQPPDPQRYADLLRVVYPVIKAARPDVLVLGGALAPTLEPVGSPHALDDVLYLEGLYQAGAHANFDALAVHTYGFNAPADAPPARDALNFRRAELLRAVMVRYGDADKPVYITESGWNDHPRWIYGVTPSQRIRYTLDALTRAESAWDWAQTVCVWVLRYPRPTYSYPDSFTLITPDFQFMPIYYALQAYARGWQTSEALWLPAPQE